MSEQQPPAVQDTAAVAGPNEAPGAAENQPQDVDWQKRYNNLQPEYTRTTQQLKEAEQRQQWYDLLVSSEDLDTRRQAAEVLGYQLPDDENDSSEEEGLEPTEYDEFGDPVDQRLTALEERLNAEQEAMRMAEQGALIREIVDERMSQFEGLPTEDQDWILAYAINSLQPKHEPGIPVPLPDLEQAFELWQARETERQKAWAKTKRAPHVMPGGVTADQVPDTSTHEGRTAEMMRRLMEAQQPD